MISASQVLRVPQQQTSNTSMPRSCYQVCRVPHTSCKTYMHKEGLDTVSPGVLRYVVQLS